MNAKGKTLSHAILGVSLFTFKSFKSELLKQAEQNYAMSTFCAPQIWPSGRVCHLSLNTWLDNSVRR